VMEKPFEGPRGAEGHQTPPATPQKSVIPERGNRKDRPRYYQFEWQNECTSKMTDGSSVIVEGSFGRDGYRSTKVLGYLMKVGGSLWIACVGERRSDPLPLFKAKDAARRMDRERDFGTDVSDPVRALNLATAAEIDAVDRTQWPINVMGSQNRRRGIIAPEIREAVLAMEIGFIADEGSVRPLQGDHYPLEFREGGYPKLPAFLDRRLAREEVLK
jgi:hypothetical protein